MRYFFQVLRCYGRRSRLVLLYGCALLLLMRCVATSSPPGTGATAGTNTALPDQADQDGDGVLNQADRCPDTPAGTRVDASGCPLDADGDGVPDHLDRCPDRPGPASNEGCPFDTDGDGVPDRPAPPAKPTPKPRPKPTRALTGVGLAAHAARPTRVAASASIPQPGGLDTMSVPGSTAAHPPQMAGPGPTETGPPHEETLEDYQRQGLLAAHIPPRMGLDTVSLVTLAIYEDTEGGGTTRAKTTELRGVVGQGPGTQVRSFSITRTMAARLLDPDKAFDITPEGDVPMQDINNRYMRRYTWQVRPLVAGRHLLKIWVKYRVPKTAQHPDGMEQNAEAYRQKVTVPQTEQAFAKAAIGYIEAHWELLTALATGLSAVLAWLRRKKNNDTAASPSAGPGRLTGPG